jgi:hypothetical protein
VGGTGAGARTRGRVGARAALTPQSALAVTHAATVRSLLRGHGDTGSVRAVPGEAPASRALLENRNITNGPMTFDQAATLARTYLNWLTLVRGVGGE